MAKRKVRKLGDVLLDLETLLDELMDHGIQWGDLLALVHSWLMVHRPGDRERYEEDGSHPEFYYGPNRNKKK